MERVLLGYWRSSSSWRVRIALNWKGLPYGTVPVHLVKDGGAQHHPEHRAVNPMGQVPVLLEEGIPLSQSMAILEYLEETHPDLPASGPSSGSRPGPAVRRGHQQRHSTHPEPSRDAVPQA